MEKYHMELRNRFELETKTNHCLPTWDYVFWLEDFIQQLQNTSSNSDYAKLPNTVTYIQCQHEYGYVSTTAFVGYKCKKCGYILVV